MSVASVIVLTILVNSSVSATSTGLLLASKNSGHSNLTGARNSPSSVSTILPCYSSASASSWTMMVRRYVFKTQKVRQECAQLVDICSFLDQYFECSTLSQDVCNEMTKAWILDDSALAYSDVDAQCIATYANASEKIKPPIDGALKPSGPITINGTPRSNPAIDGSVVKGYETQTLIPNSSLVEISDPKFSRNELMTSDASLNRAFFTDNRSGGNGGAIFPLNDSTLTVHDSSFTNNMASAGGCFYVENSTVSIVGSRFHRNEADIDGGAIRVEQGGCICKDSIFEENSSLDEGGAIHIENATYVTMQSLKFTSKDAAFGSVVRIDKSRTNVTLKDVHFQGGVVELTGAALYIDTSNVTVDGATFVNNIAPYGGAIYAQAFNITIKNAKFEKNTATVMGGAISGDNGNVTFKNTTFDGNHAYLGGALHFYNTTVDASELVFLNNSASGGGVNLVSGSKRSSIFETPEVGSSFLCFECNFSKSIARESGGGLNIQSQHGEALVVAQLEDYQFEQNSASVFRGGIYLKRPFNQTKFFSNRTSCADLFTLNLSVISFHRVDLDGVFFGVVSWDCYEFANNSEFLGLLRMKKASRLRTYRQRPFLQGINAPKGTKNISSPVLPYVRNCNIREVKGYNLSEISTGPTSIQINETVPGERLPNILIECYDEYGNVAKSGEDGFTASIRSNIGGDLGEILAISQDDGSWKIKGVTNPPSGAFNRSYSYELEIAFSLAFVKPITVLINVRECRIDEQKEDEGVQCKQCDATQYNFNPMVESCKHCEDTLDCSGIYVVPKDGYWHSSPCHVPAQKCLTAKACIETASLWNKMRDPKFGNLSAALKNYSCNLSNTCLEEYHKLQCNEGYKGVLCCSCKENYGPSSSFACTRCSGPAVSVLVLVCVCVWLAGFAAMTIHGSKTIEERIALVSQPLHNIASFKGCPILASKSEATEQDDKKQDKDKERTRVVAFVNTTHKRALKVALKLSAIFQKLRQHGQTNGATITVETTEEINNLRLVRLAKWKLCEVLKVAVNFLQAISVAAVINVEWTTYMLTMFNLSAFAGGASTALVRRAIQCFPWCNGTRYATYIGLVSTLLVPTFVVLCMVAFFGLVAYKESTGKYYFVKRSALAALAICYFSYLNITEVAMMVFYCVGVHTDDDFSSEHETFYWALDTSIQCTDQGHKSMMVFGGILVALFSVGFPLISAFVLVLCQKSDGSRDLEWMTDILGFLHRAYKREFVFWESIVMLRKAMLSEIAVFSYYLGGHSQGVLASCILSVCLFLQSIYRPYRVEFDTVNDVESLSLLISGITFNVAQFFMKDKTNETVKVALSVFLMVSIIGFLVYLVWRLLACFVDVFKAELIVSGAFVDENESSCGIVKAWIGSKLGLSKCPSGTDDDDVFGDVELGSTESGKSTDDTSDTST